MKFINVALEEFKSKFKKMILGWLLDVAEGCWQNDKMLDNKMQLNTMESSLAELFLTLIK